MGRKLLFLTALLLSTTGPTTNGFGAAGPAFAGPKIASFGAAGPAFAGPNIASFGAAGPAFAGPNIVSFGAAGPTRVVDLAGKAVNPLVMPAGRKATVLVFATTDCPISNRYAPEILALAAKFKKQGIDFTLVYPVATDTAAVIGDHMKKFGYTIGAVRDTAQELVKHTGVKVTPEAAVIGAGGAVLYRGRIDDRYLEFGKDRQQPTERTLERALEAIVHGKPVAVRETQAVGCFLSDLTK